ncbi:hypothetical protein [Bradyrhizobium embrapense]|uniref:hypothetical protein n=1 Tax=Bradyrhizobium embrapense TaxID=630921 RepID=UPI00067D1BDA|nr:hypothetical protein [Bradyrhizobium embrapense]
MTILDRPPSDWKRPAMPVRTKLDVVIRQEGKCKQTGEKLGTLENTRFDHRPALWERQFDTVADDTIPPANDAAFIDACTVAGHDVRTHGNGATTVGSDSHRRAKIKRMTDPKPAKPKRKIRGRSTFPKRKVRRFG